MTGGANPLVNLGFRIEFDKIRAEHVEPGIEELVAGARERLERLAAVAGERTFENTMAELDTMTEPLDRAMSVVRHLEAVTTYPELRAAYNAVQPAAAAFYSSIPLHEGLWKALQDYAGTEEAKALKGVRRRFLVKTMDDFRRHGAELDPAGKKRLEELDVELTKLTTRFAEHTLDATNAFELMVEDSSQLAGLPDSAIEAARESAKSKNRDGWRFTLQSPSYLAVMTYLDNRDLRHQVWHAYNTRCSSGRFDNREVIVRILEMRRAKADLLGYRDYADLVLEDRMAKNGAAAQAFLNRLRGRSQPYFEKENEQLHRFRRQLEGADAPGIEPWDVAYYSEKLRQAEYEFNEEDLRPYFPLDRVVEGLFQLVRRVLGVRVVEEEGAPVWDPATRYYQILDESGERLGAFYADWLPRENKRGGAWMDAFVTGKPAADGWSPHLGLMCGNLTPPVGGKPALLTHRDVETVFHEFGHLLHHLLTRVPVRSMAGTSVAWDFVELPSQIMENWCWEREALDLFAGHWETGERIPEELFAKMKRAQTYRAANAQMRQLGFGFADLALHRDYDPGKDGDVLSYVRPISEGFSPAPLPDDYAMVAGFTHLFANPVGYAAGYYSYKWSEVLDADAFTRFAEAGIFSREVGGEFRDKILAAGDSEDPAELFRSFMGRDPDVTALLRRQGLEGLATESSAS